MPMKTKHLIIAAILILNFYQGLSQVYPTFGPEIKVTINGLTFDAMEPFISSDGNTLFFNSLNSGGNTNLYYATKVNDSTFNYAGLVGGAYNPGTAHLDAVASLDSLNNFFWVSTRNYPTQMENLHRGIYANGNVSNITRVYGDFNIYEYNYPFGWLIMDACINFQGDKLYFCNAYFNFSSTTGVPDESNPGIAQKVNDSTFIKQSNSDSIFSNISDTNYLVYALQVTKDGLELYFTRLLKNTYNTEICVSVRNSVLDIFSLPMIIHSNIYFVPEAPTVTTDKQKIYYHQKDSTNVYKIYLRYRTGTTGIEKQKTTETLKVYPNPTRDLIYIELPSAKTSIEISIYSILGERIFCALDMTTIDISNFNNGIYFLMAKYDNKIITTKIIKD